MKKDTIFQFVCFDTPLMPGEFLPLWESFAEKFVSNRASAISLHQQEANKNKFRYLSKNEWPSNDFQFVFQKGKISDKFPAGQVKVIQAGGYSPVQIEYAKKTVKDEVRIMAFVNDTRTDLDFYRQLKPYSYLNIYEAYYENSLFTYVLEFFVKEANASAIIDQLKKQSLQTETGMYRECILEHA
jgi:hypothetical protein